MKAMPILLAYLCVNQHRRGRERGGGERQTDRQTYRTERQRETDRNREIERGRESDRRETTDKEREKLVWYQNKDTKERQIYILAVFGEILLCHISILLPTHDFLNPT